MLPAPPPGFLPVLFAAIATLFAVLALQSRPGTPARRARGRIAIVFAVVALGVWLMQGGGG